MQKKKKKGGGTLMENLDEVLVYHFIPWLQLHFIPSSHQKLWTAGPELNS